MIAPDNPELLGLLPRHMRELDPDIYLSDNYLVLDFETTAIEYGSPHNPENEIILACWRHGTSSLTYRETGQTWDMEHLLRAVVDVDFIVAHNSKFELGWLSRCGLDIAKVLPFCTMIAEKELHGNQKVPLSLAETLKRRELGFKDSVGLLIRKGVDPRQIPTEWLSRYCAIDVETTQKLFLKQRRELLERGMLGEVFTRNILTPVLFDIESKGLHLDSTRVEKVYRKLVDEQEDLERRWSELTGGVNVNSRQQLADYLYNKLHLKVPVSETGKPMLTREGKPSCNAEARSRLKPWTKEQKKVIRIMNELLDVNRSLDKIVHKLKETVNAGGQVYAEFSQTSSATGRLTSRGRQQSIQLQNFNRAYRPLVTARNPGWFIGDGDSAGIEFRAAVDLARDDQGRADFEAQVDIHAFSASIIYASRWKPDLPSKSGGNKELRRKAKAFTFKPLYGGTSGTPAQRKYFDLFRKRYSGIAEMQRGWAEQVLRTKELKLVTGGSFYWPNCRIAGQGHYIVHTTEIYDYPIQRFATAEMIPTATCYLWHLMRAAKMRSFLITLVHDSAVGEIHPEEVEQWSAYLKYCFNEWIVKYLKKVYNYEWLTPLESEVSVLKAWDDHDPELWDSQWS